MKQQVKRLTVLMACLSLFALAGCSGGGGSSSDTTTTSSVSGVVADGYLVGAKVCLDKNGNKVCDADEPTATTTTGGSYTLSNVSAADAAAYPILVEVPTTATDEQRGDVAKAYVLSSPAGKYEFVSPLTTLVQNQVETAGLTAEQAEATVRNQLQLSEATSLFENFQPGSASATAEQKLAASVAKVIADTIATNKAAIEAAVGASSTTVSAVVNLVVQQVMQQLPTVVQQVRTNLVDGVLPEDKVATVINSSDVVISTDDTTTLQQQLDATASVQQVAASDLATVLSSGVYGLMWWQDGYDQQTQTPIFTTVYEKSLFTVVDSRITFSEYVLSGSSWVAQDISPELFLTSTGWQQDTPDYGTLVGDTYSSPNGHDNVKLSVVKYSVAGQPFAAYHTEDDQQAPAGVFPAGAEAYRLTMIPSVDTYRLDTDWEMCSQYGQDGTCVTYITTFTDLISNYRYPDGWTMDSDNISFRFDALNSTTNSGKLYLYDDTLVEAIPVESSYQIRTVNGQQILVADARPLGGGYIIFAVYNGRVLGGDFYPANVAGLSEGFMFNKLAINAIASAVGLPAIP